MAAVFFGVEQDVNKKKNTAESCSVLIFYGAGFLPERVQALGSALLAFALQEVQESA